MEAWRGAAEDLYSNGTALLSSLFKRYLRMWSAFCGALPLTPGGYTFVLMACTSPLSFGRAIAAEFSCCPTSLLSPGISHGCTVTVQTSLRLQCVPPRKAEFWMLMIMDAMCARRKKCSTRVLVLYRMGQIWLRSEIPPTVPGAPWTVPNEDVCELGRDALDDGARIRPPRAQGSPQGSAPIPLSS